MRTIGIDPGVGGGMAYINPAANEIETIAFKNATERDICDAIVRWTFMHQPHAMIEKVASSPQMGVVSAFTFGKSYGFLRGLLTGRTPFEEISPQKWQKAMECLTKGDKNVSKARAQQLFPQLKITHAIADALLIAEFARRECAKRYSLKSN